MSSFAALDLGGNAVVAADIDYAEVGGASAMLMVCMTGTAVKLSNPEILGDGKAERIDALVIMHTKLREIDEYELDAE